MLDLRRGESLANTSRTYDAEGILISDNRYSQPVFEGWHSHSNIHFSLILDGGNLESRKNSEMDVNRGKVLCYHRGELHRNRNTIHPSRNINLEIEEKFFRSYETVFSYPNSSYDEISASVLLVRIFKEANSPDDLSTNAIHQLVLSLLHPGTKNPRKSSKPVWVKRIREKIHDSWDENQPLSDLAKELNVHPVTISKHFPHYFHCTYGEYIRNIRIQKAISMIRGHQSLTSIAYSCGFFDQSHFIHTFKNLTGYLPGEFRKV